jgi:hypothetical protein
MPPLLTRADCCLVAVITGWGRGYRQIHRLLIAANGNHPLIGSHAQRRTTFADEDVRAW